MGYEFRIRFNNDDPAQLWEMLKSAPEAAERRVPRPAIEYRAPSTTGPIPDATLEFTSQGLYFCVHGGEGRRFLGIVVALLSRDHCPVTVEELEH
jgi:hypothetical protein